EEPVPAAQARLATSVRRLSDAAHPTAAVVRTLAQVHVDAPELVDRPTTALLDQLVDTDIDFATADLTTVTTKHPTLFGDISPAERDQALAGAQRAQRLFRITGEAGELRMLSSALDVTGLPMGGAFDIARLSKPAFLARFPGAAPAEVTALQRVHN